MSITYTLPDVALKTKLGLVNIQLNNPATYKFWLFKNAFTVADTTTVASLTQCDFSGYSAQHPGAGTLTGGVGVSPASLSLAPCTFTCTGGTPQTVWGAALDFSPLGFDLLAVTNLPNGPQIVSQAGDSIIAQLTITDQRAPGQP